MHILAGDLVHLKLVVYLGRVTRFLVVKSLGRLHAALFQSAAGRDRHAVFLVLYEGRVVVRGRQFVDVACMCKESLMIAFFVFVDHVGENAASVAAPALGALISLIG